MNYEHLFFAQRLKPDCGYLVRDTETEITNIRRIHGDLYITCPIEKPCEWHLYEVHQATGKEIYQYPMLSTPVSSVHNLYFVLIEKMPYILFLSS